jgi:spore coat protein U-like protein
MKILKIISTISLALLTTSSFAVTQNLSVPVSATAVAYCSITSSPGMAFGNYTSSGFNTSSGTIGFTCSKSTPWSLTLTGTTQMSDGAGGNLNYSLYQDIGRTVALLTTSGTSFTISGTGTGSAQTITTYGIVPMGQFVQSGIYSTNLVVTLNY